MNNQNANFVDFQDDDFQRMWEEQENDDMSDDLPIVQRGTSPPSSQGSEGSPPLMSEEPSSHDSIFEEQDENSIPRVVRQAPPVVLPTKTRLKVTVKRLHVVSEWKWVQGGDDTCGICRMPFEACCVDCQMPGDSCPLVLGECKHPFHMHCIVKWTEAQNAAKPQCPLCRQEWKFAENP